jgi:hypothetical protein
MKKRKAKEQPEDSKKQDDDIIILDVGMTLFKTRKSTLVKYPSTLLGMMFSQEKIPLDKQEDGSYFFDQDPTEFPYILSYYRTGFFPKPIVSDRNKWEAELAFWGLTEPKLPPAKIIDIPEQIDFKAKESMMGLLLDYTKTSDYQKVIESGHKRFDWKIIDGHKYTLEGGRKITPYDLLRVPGRMKVFRNLVRECFHCRIRRVKKWHGFDWADSWPACIDSNYSHAEKKKLKLDYFQIWFVPSLPTDSPDDSDHIEQ